MFKWGVENELVPVEIYRALAAVAGLRKGRTEARETDPVTPVPDAVVDATLPHLSETIHAMVQIQRQTGCRPGEVCIIRPRDVDISGDVWCYRPESHKMQHHETDRRIYIGPNAQAVLRPWLIRRADTYCFSPAESRTVFDAERRRNRTTPLTPSHS